MYSLYVRNVNHALPAGINLFRYSSGLLQTAPRGMPTLEYPQPVTTVYECPMERVLFSPVRDANPFFHFFEALWILAGRNDVAFLAYFLPRMADYSDDGKVFHAPYGARLRRYMDQPYTGGIDQLKRVAEMLVKDPDTRRAVCAIWDAELDLGTDSKDIPCNDLLAFRVRKGRLELTVYNRSNDMIWGAYGANAVQFSTILEYVAGIVNLPVGRYYQVSNSFHVYLNDQYKKLYNMGMAIDDPYSSCEELPAGVEPIRPMGLFTGATVEAFDYDLAHFFKAWDSGRGTGVIWDDFATPYFRDVVAPMWTAFQSYRWYKADKKLGFNIKVLPELVGEQVKAKDWAFGAGTWLDRRINK